MEMSIVYFLNALLNKYNGERERKKLRNEKIKKAENRNSSTTLHKMCYKLSLSYKGSQEQTDAECRIIK